MNFIYMHMSNLLDDVVSVKKKMFIEVLIVELAHQLSESIQCWKSIQGYGDWPAGLLNMQFSQGADWSKACGNRSAEHGGSIN